LARNVVRLAREEKASLIVLKEFPAHYRSALSCFLYRGFARVPSMPMTRLNIAYESFDDYMKRALKSATRKGLRKKFRAAETSAPIVLEVVTDASAVVDEIFPLYLQVLNRSKLQFEKLTKAYFRELGRRMPDKVRFFLWRQNGKLVAFALCMIEGDTIYGEYIGLDYAVALDLHLYHYVMRDVISWGIENGFTSLMSSALNYAPKLQMRHVLEPLDLYVRHTSPLVNAILKRILPWLEPTRHDPNLKQFPNYDSLWAGSTRL
jgi:predicted N-acyltransferase